MPGHHHQHRRPPGLPETQRHVDRRKPQITLRQPTRRVAGPRGRIRRDEQRPQPRNPRPQNATRSGPADPLADHRRRHRRKLRQQLPDRRLDTSTADGRGGREYFGGSAAANARHTAFRDTPNRLQIALIGIPSARCNRRISAPSSTASTPLTVAQGVQFQSAPRGHYSIGTDRPGQTVRAVASFTWRLQR
jgi:hypothetical protein